ncbi:hypothetical protein [Sphingomonas sp. DBB INV C78]|uniref:hypothetical protein n=1 Tax=Sphingomonas sp. DBB INV C78 TaxID=3349434 RepID=UPI0036D354F7
MMTQIGQEATSLCAAVADEIRGVRALIEQLAEILVADERFCMDYMDQLQSFDLVIQHADESADLLDRVAQGQAIPDAIDRVRLTVVQERLRAAIG